MYGSLYQLRPSLTLTCHCRLRWHLIRALQLFVEHVVLRYADVKELTDSAKKMYFVS